jgi:hypothetical protein
VPEVTVHRRRLHAGQARIKADPARFRVAMIGRRWGKTILGVDEAQDVLLKGGWVGWFCPNYKYAIEPWGDLVRRMRPAARRVDEQKRRVELLTGGVFKLWTCDDPDPGRGDAYDLAILDEAGLIRNLKAIWDASIRPTLTDRQGRGLFLGTPKGRSHDFSVLFAKADGEAEGGWKAFRAATVENTTLPGLADEVQAAKRDLPAQVFSQEYEGVPADDGGNPFGLDAIAACTVPRMAEQAPVVWGWDFARAQDWTVGIALDRERNVVDYQRWQLVPWGETYRRVREHEGDTLGWGDSTGIGDAVVEDIQRVGVPLFGYGFTPKSKQQLMERLATAIQQREITYPDGPIRAELETFGYEYTAHGVRYTSPDGMHDDCVMALALAVYGRDQLGDIPEPVRPKDRSDDIHPGLTERYPGLVEGTKREPVGLNKYTPSRVRTEAGW